MVQDRIRSYFASDSFLWQNLSGDLALRYGNVIKEIMAQLHYEKLKMTDRVSVDIGCGGGRYTQLLLKYFSLVYGVDYTFHFVRAGKAKFGEEINFVCGDAINLPFGDGIVDFILSVGLTEYLSPSQLIDFISETWRVLKPGGYMLIRFWKVGGATHLLSKIGKGVATAYPEFFFIRDRESTKLAKNVILEGLLLLVGY